MLGIWLAPVTCGNYVGGCTFMAWRGGVPVIVFEGWESVKGRF